MAFQAKSHDVSDLDDMKDKRANRKRSKMFIDRKRAHTLHCTNEMCQRRFSIRTRANSEPHKECVIGRLRSKRLYWSVYKSGQNGRIRRRIHNDLKYCIKKNTSEEFIMPGTGNKNCKEVQWGRYNHKIPIFGGEYAFHL